jgi:hypothetical protein
MMSSDVSDGRMQASTRRRCSKAAPDFSSLCLYRSDPDANMGVSKDPWPRCAQWSQLGRGRRELKLQLDKSQQTSNWTRRSLSPQQVACAAADVEVLIELETRLRTSLPLFEARANHEHS